FPVKNALMADFPEITNAATIFRPSSWGTSPVIKVDDINYYEDDLVFAEQSLLEIYDFPALKGEISHALRGPNKIVLTERAARKYFGTDDPIGRRVRMDDFVDLEVSAVVGDLPDNTHLKFDMMASFDTFKSFFNDQTFFDTQWVWVAGWLYVTIDSEQDARKVANGLPGFIQKHFPANLADNGMAMHLQKADDIHLTSNVELEFRPNGNIQ